MTDPNNSLLGGQPEQITPTPHHGLSAEQIQPGTKCPTCQRRVNHPKQDSSPTSKTRAYRVPTDEIDAHQEILEAAGYHTGLYETPYWQFKVYTLALALLLQDESMKGYATEPATAGDSERTL